jgi:uncharacterized membrane protein YkoI
MRFLATFLVFTFGLALPAMAAPVSIDDARAMAFDKGIVKIGEVELDDGVWEIEGWDASGHEIEMKVDAGSGRIIKLERD